MPALFSEPSQTKRFSKKSWSSLHERRLHCRSYSHLKKPKPDFLSFQRKQAEKFRQNALTLQNEDKTNKQTKNPSPRPAASQNPPLLRAAGFCLSFISSGIYRRFKWAGFTTGTAITGDKTAGRVSVISKTLPYLTKKRKMSRP